ncbi:D-alanine--D-alanine ligase [Candidatus Marinamargulisbacteria bacterium SCGC AAA071-K20]|nr:D-alanine--D-alanine ligase [Candidatus Marinamargulisbacteria bacterium SCGC AAA071-K20]
MISEFESKVIGVICGGFSHERDVSLSSGQNVFEALKRRGYDVIKLDPVTESDWEKKCHVAFIALHGKYGEDGTVQAILEREGIPYTGSGVNTSVIAMNKFSSKKIFMEANIPTANFMMATDALKTLPKGFEYPVFVKPYDGGSSVDTFVIDTEKDLEEKTTFLGERYGAYLVESFLEGREITIGIVENPKPMALPILELRPENRFYDYDAKYTEGKTKFVIPAELSELDTKKCQGLALSVYKLMNCKGMSRIDMIVDPVKGPFVLELNTVPGLTNTSDLPAQARNAGMSFDDLIELILASAIV